MIEGRDQAAVNRHIRLGMVGGGQGAFIGPVHRIAARLDDQYVLVAGALDSEPKRARVSALELGIASDRAYDDFETMARAESAREDGVEVVAIVTPNNLHAPIASAFLKAGIHVICEKPLATSVADARELARLAKESGKLFAVTYNYTGYPMIRHARAMVAAGELGEIRVVQAEYAQDWLTERVEATGQRQAAWRTDPAQAGEGGALGDIGTHAYHLACFVSGLTLDSLCADLTTFVPGRRLDDNVQILLRFHGGARGMLWATQVAPGNENGLRLRIYGTKGGLEWQQENPNELRFAPFGEPPRLVTRGGAGAGPTAARVTRIPAGHPEGYLEGFATLYAEIARAIRAARDGQLPEPDVTFPTVMDGLAGVEFIDAAVRSSANGAVWVEQPTSAVSIIEEH